MVITHAVSRNANAPDTICVRGIGVYCTRLYRAAAQASFWLKKSMVRFQASSAAALS